MKNKVLLFITSTWIGLAGLISPMWIGIVYMFITGHSKGYAYDLGSEMDISIMFGMVGLLLWLVSVMPVMCFSCVKYRKIKKLLIFLPIGIFFVCFLIGVFLLGAEKFLEFFNL